MDIPHQIGSGIGTGQPRRRSRLHTATTAIGTACVVTASLPVPAHAGAGQPIRPPGPGSPGRIQALATLAPPACRPFATTGPSHATSGDW